MGVKFQQEFLSCVKDDLAPLLQQDWQEIGDNHVPLDPDFDAYSDLEEVGALKIFTARIDGELVGYFAVVIVPSLQSKGKILAINESIFVAKQYRHKLVGPKLFRFVEKCLKDDGYDRLYVVAREKNPIGDSLVKMGYNKIETRYEKVL